MQKICIYLKIKQKKYKKFMYCSKAKKCVDFDFCRDCPFKEYQKQKQKRDYNPNSIIGNLVINDIKNNKTYQLYGNKVPYYHKNHIFGGKNRKNSEKYGLFVWMTADDHLLGKDSYHKNSNLQIALKIIAQKNFEKNYPNLNFLQIFGENYIDIKVEGVIGYERY